MKLCLVQVGAEAAPDLPGTSPGSEWVACSNSYWPRPATSNGDTSYEDSNGSKHNNTAL